MRTLPLAAVLAALASPALAGTEYLITIHGEVEFNVVSTGPLSGIADGEQATLSFRVDSDDFVNSPTFPTRGYVIDKSTWQLDFESTSIGLQSPFTGPDPLFVIRNNDPAVDGFLVSTNVNDPAGVPLAPTGSFGPFQHSFYVTYGGDLLPSLDIADAVGSYDFTGLSVFNWNIEDGPFNPVGLIFSSMTVTELVQGSATVYGCGVNPAGSMSVLSGQSKIGSALRLGVDNPLGTQAPGSIPALSIGFAPLPGFPCGINLPGFGMAGPGADGELLIDSFGPTILLFGGPWAGAGTPAPFVIFIPNDPTLVGAKLYMQGLLIDPLALQGVQIALTDAVEALIGQ